jgi:hypothetical protein
MMVLAWIAAGVAATALCNWAWHLTFDRGPVTIVTVIFMVGGVALPPVAALGGLIYFLIWAFDMFVLDICCGHVL